MNKYNVKKAKILLLSPIQWRKRLVFCVGATLVGIVSSYFTEIANYNQSLFLKIIAYSNYMPLILCPIAFVASIFLMERFCPGVTGSGIPQAIASRIMRDPDSRRYLIGPKIIICKILLTSIGFLGGASIGREGPTVQVGAAIFLLCASFGRLTSNRGIVLAGAAAGIAAAFNTPLAGIVFAIEEMARAFEHRNSSLIMTAIVLSGAASMSILGNYSYFGYTNVNLSVIDDFIPILTIGIVCGVLGSLFARLMIDSDKFLGKFYNITNLKNKIIVAAICGFIIAALGMATHGGTYGTGYIITKEILHNQIHMVWWYAPAKFLATLVSGISGIAGGIFVPSLSVGAGFGNIFVSVFHSTPAQGIILLSMVAYFAGVTQAPLTAFIIVLEITGNATAALPLIATSVIAAGCSRIICPISFYPAMAKKFIIITKNRLREGHEAYN